MPKYKVLQPLRHDGEKYAIGDPVDLSAKDAKPLIVAGALDAKPVNAKQAGAEALVAQIEAADTVDAVKRIAADDSRASVVAARDARIQALSSAK